MIYLLSTQERIDFEDIQDIQKVTIQDCLDYFKDKNTISVDTETEGFDPYTCKIISLQLGDSSNQFVIDCRNTSIQYFKELLETKLLLLVNAQFDLRFLYHNNIYPKNIYDLFLVECILTTGLGDKDDIKDIQGDCGKQSIAL